MTPTSILEDLAFDDWEVVLQPDCQVIGYQRFVGLTELQFDFNRAFFATADDLS